MTSLCGGQAGFQIQPPSKFMSIRAGPPADTRGRPLVNPGPFNCPSGLWFSRCRSDSPQILRRRLARILSIGNNIESDLLALIEDTHPGAFHGADVHEDILAAIIRLDKAEASLVVEELHGSSGHITDLSGTSVRRPLAQPVRSRFGEKPSVQTRDARRGQVVRPKLDRRYMGRFD
jgi:hypothetical protein